MTPPNEFVRPPAPGAWIWYVVLCVLMALYNFAIVWLGVLFAQNDAAWTKALEMPTGYFAQYSMMLMASGVIFGVGNLILPFLPKKPWMYVLHVVNIIAAGLTCILLPVAVPTFILFLKPEAREFFDFR